VNQQTEIDNIGSSEYPAAGLTLTRSSTLAITTAGTTITWQVETRNYGYTWTGSTITIPGSGYYNFTMLYNSTVAHTVQARLFVNTVNVAFMASYAQSSTRQAVTITRYCTTGDSIQINLIPSLNTTINVVAENDVSETPFLHIVQLTGSVE
jgi:radical SAM superfamily enzyme with C-terminal helix-hairpin-helix motif